MSQQFQSAPCGGRPYPTVIRASIGRFIHAPWGDDDNLMVQQGKRFNPRPRAGATVCAGCAFCYLPVSIAGVWATFKKMHYR